jgi:hypothetical protein
MLKYYLCSFQRISLYSLLYIYKKASTDGKIQDKKTQGQTEERPPIKDKPSVFQL